MPQLYRTDKKSAIIFPASTKTALFQHSLFPLAQLSTIYFVITHYLTAIDKIRLPFFYLNFRA